MAARGWYVQPQLSFGGSPATIHLSVSAATLASVEDFLDRARRRGRRRRWRPGRSRVDPDVVAFIEALDPAALRTTTSTGCCGRRAGAAPGGRLDLPERMAEVNALLDVAAPALREALLKAFLDRLSRPTR